MTTLISQNPLALRNPFSVLEHSHETPLRVTNEDELDLASWCVVNSPCPTDDEDDALGDEIYHWQSSSEEGVDPNETSSSLPTPLRLSASSDGFTNISKATTAHSINSVTATCPENRHDWILKLRKTRLRTQVGAAAVSNPSISTHEPPEKTKPQKRKDTTATAQDEESDEMLYMSMTEHELSKSTKAAKLMNHRVATHHDRELAKALGCFSEEAGKVDKKALQTRSSKTKSKNRANKSRLHPGDF
ncbi:hypothetical protein BG011_009570 [Mortierella polycephala]|uniref:Uncharacterized protein n=1 Tax=Mortierella polycephala TaxID=41804 RepID=A0A9P6PM02_9FUNG|nr:hypothetical protein BG011_009570 [Mortierella polycephala]